MKTLAKVIDRILNRKASDFPIAWCDTLDYDPKDKPDGHILTLKKWEEGKLTYITYIRWI